MEAWFVTKAIVLMLVGSLQHGEPAEIAPATNHPPRLLYKMLDPEEIQLHTVVEINGEDLFTDDDRDDLVFSAMSQSESAASVKVEGSLIRVTANKTGPVAIIIAASDQKGGVAKAAYRFIVMENK